MPSDEGRPRPQTAKDALQEMADAAPDWELDQRSYRTLVLLVYQWLIDLRESLRAKLTKGE